MAPKSVKRVAIVGLSGMGKTSLFNMLCGADAHVLRDAPLCTAEEKEATCDLGDEHKCTVRDTRGLHEVGSENFMAKVTTLFRTSTTEELQKRLKNLVKDHELHLLIYCMSAQSRNKTTSHATLYKAFKSVGVPVVVVVTNLESQDPPLERWWSMNNALLEKLGMKSSTEHACVTTLPIQRLTEVERRLHDESCAKVKTLISSQIL